MQKDIKCKRLTGKIAIITASTHGIGLAIAERFGLEGATVIVSSRNERNVKKAEEKLRQLGIKAYGVVCHVSNANHRKNLFNKAAELGGLDILVSNAGANPTNVRILDCDERNWDKNFDVNVKAAYLLSKEALPLLRQSKNGRIIFISSFAGLLPSNYMNVYNYGAYAVSKTALMGLSKRIAFELRKENITVNCLVPSAFETPFAKILTEDKKFVEETMKFVKRFGKPEDLCGIAAFLASDESEYITGENIVVAGGLPSRL